MHPTPANATRDAPGHQHGGREPGSEGGKGGGHATCGARGAGRTRTQTTHCRKMGANHKHGASGGAVAHGGAVHVPVTWSATPSATVADSTAKIYLKYFLV